MVVSTQNKALAGIIFSLTLAGCLHQGRPVIADRSPPARPATQPAPVVRPQPAPRPATRIPVEEGARNSSYLVRRGDTLYSIAWRFDLNPQGLAYANDIPPPYTIFPGQRLQLKVALPPRPARDGSRVPTSRPDRPVPQPAPAPAPAAESVDEHLSGLARWVWPVESAPSRPYSKSNKGVDFDLMPGARSQVKAANSGKVVYAGNGIGGYENLIIIKHSDVLLSAYSFNGKNAVEEQAQVRAGQKVAEIIPAGRTVQKLHFELRRSGAPVNPGVYIR